MREKTAKITKANFINIETASPPRNLPIEGEKPIDAVTKTRTNIVMEAIKNGAKLLIPLFMLFVAIFRLSIWFLLSCLASKERAHR